MDEEPLITVRYGFAVLRQQSPRFYFKPETRAERFRSWAWRTWSATVDVALLALFLFCMSVLFR